MCVKWHFGFYFIWQAIVLQRKKCSQSTDFIKELWDPIEPVRYVAIKEVEMYQFIRYEQQTQMSVFIQCMSLVFQCPCYYSSMVQNLVWWKLHIVRVHILPTEGDLRDLLWHSICVPKHEIQIHLAERSVGSVWGNPISRTGTPYPERESHPLTSELCQQNGRLDLGNQPTVFMDWA